MATTPSSLYSLIRERVRGEGSGKLMNQLLIIIEKLWDHNVLDQKIHSKGELSSIKKRLANSTYQFSFMRRSWIPKPKKAGAPHYPT